MNDKTVATVNVVTSSYYKRTRGPSQLTWLECRRPLALSTDKPNTQRRRRRDLTVELSRVGGVNAPVGSRDPVYNFLCRWRQMTT